MRVLPVLLCALLLALSGCATVTTPPKKVDAADSRIEQAQAQQQVNSPAVKVLKRKIAIARFSNETRYGRSFQTDANLDPLGKQASDILASRLVASQQFLVFERPDLGKIKDEQKLLTDNNLIGVDALILGSVTEFGRSTTGERGFLSSTKVQTAQAKVEIRLADPHTGHVFFSASGSGKASTESGEIAGYGSKADYDAALNDRAIAAAISDVLGRLMTKLEERPWRTEILKVDGNQVYLAAGARQGLKVGDTLQLYQEGDKVKNEKTGFMIDLPPTPVGVVQVTSLFGDSETNEGAVATLQAGKAKADKGTKSAIYAAESAKTGKEH